MSTGQQPVCQQLLFGCCGLRLIGGWHLFVAGAVECLQHPTGGGGVAIQYGSGAAAGFDFVGGLEGQATFASDSIVATDAVLLQQGCGLCRESNFGRGGGGGIARTFEGSSLETIRHMVASGIGITVLPKGSVPAVPSPDHMLHYVTFEDPVPSRRVVIAWRKSFTQIGRAHV